MPIFLAVLMAYRGQTVKRSTSHIVLAAFAEFGYFSVFTIGYSVVSRCYGSARRGCAHLKPTTVQRLRLVFSFV